MEEKKQTSKAMSNEEIAKEAIALVENEWHQYEDAVVYVTDRVAFTVRDLIKTLRKNYWGIFDVPDDPITGKKLTWVGITEWIVDTWVKNSDMDAKDIRVTSKISKLVGLVNLVRHAIMNWIDQEVMGEDLDETERGLGIDGSCIWKTFQGYDEDGKPYMIRETVDILNAYFDMTSKSIKDAYRFTERSLQTPSQIASMDGWINTKGLKGSSNLHPTDTNLSNTYSKNTTNFRDVWETWGKIPKYLITGDRNDEEEVYGHIVVSGLQAGKSEEKKVHLIETNPGGKKPYEEGHTKKIPGRWLARGPAESVMMFQGWINMVVNIRKIRASVSQLGLWKMKKGTGVSSQNISRQLANGVVLVNSLDDIEQLVTQEASVSSYKDEENIVGWAQRITSSYDAVTGEQMPSSQPATNSVIQARSAGSSFSMFKKQIGFFLERWLKNQALPILTNLLTPAEVLKMSMDMDEASSYDEQIIYYLAHQKIAEDNEKGIYYDENQVRLEIQNTIEKMKKMGRERYIKELKKIDLTKFIIRISVTDEKLDPNVQINNLTNLLKAAPQYAPSIIRYIADIMGYDLKEFEQKVQQAMNNSQEQQQMMQMQPDSQMQKPMNEQQVVTNSNLPV